MSPGLYEAAPEESRVPGLENTVQWGTNESTTDPFIAGALWAGYAGLTFLVGDLLSSLAQDAQLLERWDPATSSWKYMA